MAWQLRLHADGSRIARPSGIASDLPADPVRQSDVPGAGEVVGAILPALWPEDRTTAGGVRWMMLAWVHLDSWYGIYWWLSVTGWVFAGVFFLFLLLVMLHRRAQAKDAADEAKQ